MAEKLDAFGFPIEDLFEEEFVKVNDGKIYIPLYYFPFGGKHIDAGKIRKICYTDQGSFYAKNWGANGMTWWACDMKRNFRKNDTEWYNVELDLGDGEMFRKGFTVRDIVGFLRSLRNHLVGCQIQVGHLHMK